MLGVIIVSYNSSDVLGACLASLLASDTAELKIAVCDNNSHDATIEMVRGFATQSAIQFQELDRGEISPSTPSVAQKLTLVKSTENLGFAGGVNLGLAFFENDPEIEYFWILNPDCEVAPDAASSYLALARSTKFGLMGSRVTYLERPDIIQSDGGVVGRWSGICRSINQGKNPDAATPPAAEDLDFILGASLVVSKEFLADVGPMDERYFLYYEEVDWASRRGAHRIVLCPDAKVLHHAGTVIGTSGPGRRASPFANYFNYRNRLWFVAKFRPRALPTAYVLSSLRIVKMVLLGAFDEAHAAFRGLNGLAPPHSVRAKLSDEAARRAFK